MHYDSFADIAEVYIITSSAYISDTQSSTAKLDM